MPALFLATMASDRPAPSPVSRIERRRTYTSRRAIPIAAGDRTRRTGPADSFMPRWSTSGAPAAPVDARQSASRPRDGPIAHRADRTDRIVDSGSVEDWRVARLLSLHGGRSLRTDAVRLIRACTMRWRRRMASTGPYAVRLRGNNGLVSRRRWHRFCNRLQCRDRVQRLRDPTKGTVTQRRASSPGATASRLHARERGRDGRQQGLSARGAPRSSAGEQGPRGHCIASS